MHLRFYLLFFIITACCSFYHVNLVLILRLLEQGVKGVGEDEQLATPLPSFFIQEIWNLMDNLVIQNDTFSLLVHQETEN